MAASSSPKILIIGGGLAGLGLAQGLKQANIPFHIYERDTSASFRAQGYRLRIGPDGADGLRRLLPNHLWEAYEATCATVVHSGHRLDALTAEALKWDRGGPPPVAPRTNMQIPRHMHDGKAYNADRAVLRSVLLTGLEEHISFGKRLERYDTVSNEEIEAHFADGTSARGSFLVGADGIRSVVRKQLFPNFGVLDTEGRAVFGKSIITDELVRQVAPEVVDQGNTIIKDNQENRVLLFCDTMRWNREESKPFADQLGIQLPADYVYWVLVFRKDVVSAEEEDSLLSLSSEQSAQKGIGLTTHWHDQLKGILTNQNPDAASTLAFFTAPPGFATNFEAKPAELRSRIILIGDSAHPMPPVGGIGANAGFQDAADLCDALIRMHGASDAEERAGFVHEFEQKMLARSGGAVERISAGAGNFFAMRPRDELKEAKMSH